MARKLEESSWLAQSIVDMRRNEEIGSPRYNCLQILKLMVNEADDETNERIYRENRDGQLYIIIGDIPSLTPTAGTDFDREGIRSRLLGLGTRYSGVNVLVTYDLNSAVINVSELMDQMRSGY